MSIRAFALSAAVCGALVVVGRYVFDLSWQSALVLAPVFVLCAGAVAFLVVLWAKVIRESLRSRNGA
jgi:ATP/ADP translocase